VLLGQLDYLWVYNEWIAWYFFITGTINLAALGSATYPSGLSFLLRPLFYMGLKSPSWTANIDVIEIGLRLKHRMHSDRQTNRPVRLPNSQQSAVHHWSCCGYLICLVPSDLASAPIDQGMVTGRNTQIFRCSSGLRFIIQSVVISVIHIIQYSTMICVLQWSVANRVASLQLFSCQAFVLFFCG